MRQSCQRTIPEPGGSLEQPFYLTFRPNAPNGAVAVSTHTPTPQSPPSRTNKRHPNVCNVRCKLDRHRATHTEIQSQRISGLDIIEFMIFHIGCTGRAHSISLGERQNRHRACDTNRTYRHSSICKWNTQSSQRPVSIIASSTLPLAPAPQAPAYPRRCKSMFRLRIQSHGVRGAYAALCGAEHRSIVNHFLVVCCAVTAVDIACAPARMCAHICRQ